VRNSIREDRAESHDAIMASAIDMEKAGLAKRADASSGGSTPMVDSAFVLFFGSR
jgi:hypothetical protein